MLKSLQEVYDTREDLLKDFLTRTDDLKLKLKKIPASDLSLKEFQELKKLEADISSMANAVGKSNAGTCSNKRDLGGNFAFAKVEAISIAGNVFKVKNFTELLTKTCEFLMKEDKNTFLNLRNAMPKNFSNQVKEGKDSKEILNSGIFVNTKFSATDIVHLVRRMLNFYKIDTSINNVYITIVN